MTWWSHKQHVVSLSSVKMNYHSMAHASFEMIQVHCLLHELGLLVQGNMLMYSGNKVVIFITNNPSFHECTMRIEIDYHTTRDMGFTKIITTPRVGLSNQLEDILTNGLNIISYNSLMRGIERASMALPHSLSLSLSFYLTL